MRSPDENDLHPTASQDEYEKICVQYVTVEEELADFSAQHPSDLIVYLEADCFGGACLYTGFHVKNGKKIKVYDNYDATADLLKESLSPLDVNWKNGIYFEPLVRGYFEGTES